MSCEARRSFWDSKILVWESNSYREGRLWGLPLRQRRRIFIDLIGPRLRGKTVLELGCGSAGVIEALFALGITRYVGCDFSAVAVREAKMRVASLGLGRNTEFLCEDATALPGISADFTFSLGLLDWLDDADVARLAARQKSPEFLHSFSERRFSASQLLHRAYVCLSYGMRDLSYTPRYRDAEALSRVFADGGGRRLTFHRDARMSFSTFFTGVAES